jgi:hypothetical protein
MRNRLTIIVLAALTLAVASAPVFADWFPGNGNKMHFPQLPDPNGFDVSFDTPLILADDWRCSQTGPVEDIHFWFSARGDWLDLGQPLEDQILNIHVSVHENIPDPDGPGPLYSMPGRLLWERDYSALDVRVIEYTQGLQAWWNPASGEVVPDDHQIVYQCNITDIVDPFYQKEGHIYWLDISIRSVGELGWKSADLSRYPEPFTGRHFEDDAVWQIDPPAWFELYYPGGPFQGESMDLAFVITGDAGEWGHKMHFPQLPDFDGVDVRFTSPKVLADDWLCSQTGPVEDIHFWFSAQADWLDLGMDLSQQIFNIHVSIHGNFPGPPFDRPGALLWQRDYSVDQVTITQLITDFQDWYDPNTGQWLQDDHQKIFRCDIEFIDGPFYQKRGHIYWLDVTIDAEAPLGWKTSDYRLYPPPYTGGHYLADGVWADDPASGLWQELVYFYGPYEGQSMDLSFVITGDTVEWDHKMHFPQLPDPEGLDVNFLPPKVLADDWMCTETGEVRDIHFWFSARSDWMNPSVPMENQIYNIHLSIHDNIPDPDGQGPLYSMPGPLLWEREFAVDQVDITGFVTAGQDWYDPNSGTYVADDHRRMWRCDIRHIEDPFIQEEGRIYWLDIWVDAVGELGWKVADVDRYPPPFTGLHFEDDAVWGDLPNPVWQELIWLEGPHQGESIDLAFVITKDTTLTGTGPDEAPQSSRLLQNIPNPFNPTTTIRYVLEKRSQVELAIFNIKGQLVRVLESGSRPMGLHEATWDGRDTSGTLVASGVYFYRLKAGPFLETKKMVLIK